jgi:hypothetical protein
MNHKSKLTPRAFVAACAIALAVAALPPQRTQEGAAAAPQPAQEDLYKVVNSYPPGAVGVFPEPLELPAGAIPPAVFAWPAGAQPPLTQVWVVHTSLVNAKPESDEKPPEATPGAGQPPASQKLLAFTVPQLPRGNYVVSYLPPGSGAKKSMDISVEPQLQAEHGLLAGNPGDVVEVSFGLETSYVADLSRGVSQRHVPVTLLITNASVAELATGQTASQMTGEDGFATWKVRLKAAGETALRATAPDFEPAEARLVSSPPPATPGESDAERSANRAAAEAAAQGKLARAARVASEKAAAEMLILKQGTAAGEKGGGGAVLEKRRSRAVEERQSATARQALQLKEMATARARLEEMATARTARARIVAEGAGSPTMTFPDEARAKFPEEPLSLLSPDGLLPGDIILMRGVKLYSTAILGAETLNFFRAAPYSHAALYVGDGMVAEMLKDGYVLHPLGLSIDEATQADVYRWEQLSEAQRAQIAEKAKSYAGTPYAWPQITVLGAAATGVAPPGALLVPALIADRWSGGSRQMICSELVARAYHHAGLDPTVEGLWQVRFWPTLAEILLSDDRRHDYTTPNALAASPLLRSKGRLK